MTRQDEINNTVTAIYGKPDCRAAEHFRKGFEYADTNPSEETIKRIMSLYKHWCAATWNDTPIIDYIRKNWNNPI